MGNDTRRLLDNQRVLWRTFAQLLSCSLVFLTLGGCSGGDVVGFVDRDGDGESVIHNDCDDNVAGEDGGSKRIFFADFDSDGFPSQDSTTSDCTAPEGFLDVPDREFFDEWDCDDDDSRAYPGAREDGKSTVLDDDTDSVPLTSGDRLDNDCDSFVDEGTTTFDDDLDGYCEVGVDSNQDHDCLDDGEAGQDCPYDVCFDCDDSKSTGPSVYPGASEYTVVDNAAIGTELDNDCDGKVDEETRNRDDDYDGYCEAGYPVRFCVDEIEILPPGFERFEAEGPCVNVYQVSEDDEVEPVLYEWPGYCAAAEDRGERLVKTDIEGNVLLDENGEPSYFGGDCLCYRYFAEDETSDPAIVDCFDQVPAGEVAPIPPETAYPGAPEVLYDGYDQDCDSLDLVDFDGDGFSGNVDDCYDGDTCEADLAACQVECDIRFDEATTDYVDCLAACDPIHASCLELARSIFPGATEVRYDNIDQDCDNYDLGDDDGDGYCSTLYLDAFGEPVIDEETGESLAYFPQPEGFDPDFYNPILAEAYCEIGEGDCNDFDTYVYPNALENGEGPDGFGDRQDNDCDLIVDEGTVNRDDDFDGFCEGGYPVRFEANDDQPGIKSWTQDQMNLYCGTDVDEDELPYYEEEDEDGEVDQKLYKGSCICYADINGDGIDDIGSDDDLKDCNDDRDDSYPGAAEIPYDEIDQDCDEYDLADYDGDGYCRADLEEAGYRGNAYCPNDPAAGFSDCEDGPECPSGLGNCLDLGDINGKAGTMYPGATEVAYDGVDQDCSGTDLLDLDQDGFCPSEEELVSSCNDICDSDAQACYETCGSDSQCIFECSTTDTECGVNCDFNLASQIDFSTCPSSFQSGNDDCNDTDDEIYPGASESGLQESGYGDAKDNNCDGRIDEDTVNRDDDEDGFCELGFVVKFVLSESEIPPIGADDSYEWPGYCAPESEADLKVTKGGGLPYEGDCLCFSEDGFSQEDCDDSTSERSPRNWEKPYDGLDNDCDPDQVDNADVDGDGWCLDGLLTAIYNNADCSEGRKDCDDGADSGCIEEHETCFYECDFEADDYRDCLTACDVEQATCLDRYSDTYPDAFELAYDGWDQDCDGDDIADVDGDGYCLNPEGIAEIQSETCIAACDEGDEDCLEECEEIEAYDYTVASCVYDSGGVGSDCNDSSTTGSNIYPGAPENGGTTLTTGDSQDNDCDDRVDEGTDSRDDDEDGYCEAGFQVRFVPSEDVPEDFFDTGYCQPIDPQDVCGENDPRTCNPETEQPYAGDCLCYQQYGVSDSDCNDIEGLDSDGDGIDDTAPSIYPYAREIPYDRIDQDCTGYDLADVDDDGQCKLGLSQQQYTAGNCGLKNDCDDGDDSDCLDDYYDCYDTCGENDTCKAGCESDKISCFEPYSTVYVSATEIAYDGIDQDCSGLDLADTDGDGHCLDQDGITAAIYDDCAEDCDAADGVCLTACEELSETTYDYDGAACTYSESDCDDVAVAVYPGAPENGGIPNSTVGDRQDNDCDEAIDEGTDSYDDDGDGFCEDDGEFSVKFIPRDDALEDPSSFDSTGYCTAIDPSDICGDDDPRTCNPETDLPYIGDCLCYEEHGTAEADCNDVEDLDSDNDGVDDEKPTIYPGAKEIPYDKVDQDCNGFDLADYDGDGYCRANLIGYNYGSAICVVANNDCDDGPECPNGADDCEELGEVNEEAASINAGIAEIAYDGIDQDCNGSDLADVDGDGYCLSQEGITATIYARCAIECEDTDTECLEACTELSEIEYDYDDALCSRESSGSEGADCDDTYEFSYPGADENGEKSLSVGDTRDNDCDGSVDEGTNNQDDDEDGFCEAGYLVKFVPHNDVPELFDDTGYCGPEAIVDVDADSGQPYSGDCLCYEDFGDVNVATNRDCNDDLETINPDAIEVPYDSTDQDCNGSDLADYDGDGYCRGDLTGYNYGQAVCTKGTTDCNDGPECPDGTDDCVNLGTIDPDAALVNAGEDEIPYDSVDQDCNSTDLADVDEDGYCLNQAGITAIIYERCAEDCDDDVDCLAACETASQAEYDYSNAFCEEEDSDEQGLDCNDALDQTYPGADEEGDEDDDIGDTQDNDCDGLVDEGTFNNDDDRDGYCEAGYNVKFVPSSGVILPDGFDDTGYCSSADIVQFDADSGEEFSGDCLCYLTDGDSSIDCSDSNATIHPGALEIPYDKTDQDCDGFDLADYDEDGYCRSGIPNYNYGQAICTRGVNDCDDGPECPEGVSNCSNLGDVNADAENINSGEDEIAYDSIDQDCDNTDLADVDEDGFCLEQAGITAVLFARCADDCADGDTVCEAACQTAAEVEYNYEQAFCDEEDENSEGIIVGTDCDDDYDLTYPEADEEGDRDDDIGDQRDNDCDGLVDEDTINRDDDRDGFCEAGLVVEFVALEELPGGFDDTGYCSPEEIVDLNPETGEAYLGDCLCTSGEVVVSLIDCDDGEETTYPGAAEVPYDGTDQDCNGTDIADVDGDGYCKAGLSLLGYDYDDAICNFGISDCDDDLDDIYPGADEVPYDGIDQDCSTYDLLDVDGDDYCVPIEDVALAAQADYDTICPLNDEDSNDCDDSDDDIFPGAEENGVNALSTTGDGKDNNCNGSIDEGTNNNDDDDDGYCEAGYLVEFVPRQTLPDTFDDTGYCSDDAVVDVDPETASPYLGDCLCYEENGVVDVTSNKDCNDGVDTIHPSAAEVPYDAIDQDCNGKDVADVDGDGHCLDGLSASGYDYDDAVCNDGEKDCDDEVAGINPDADEVAYDGIDQDCNNNDLVDLDGDGYCREGFSASDCINSSDCDDANLCDEEDTDCFEDAENINPGASEVCDADGIDENCSGTVNEDDALGAVTFYLDNDCDGYGVNPSDAEQTTGSRRACTAEVDYDGCELDGFDVPADLLEQYTHLCDGSAAVLSDYTADPYVGVDTSGDGVVDDDYPHACYAPLRTQVEAGIEQTVYDCNDSLVETQGVDGIPPLVNPGATEIPNNGVDENCNGVPDDDSDGDGYTTDEGDCDDTDVDTHPCYKDLEDCPEDGVDEITLLGDIADNDCDGCIDEGTEDDNYNGIFTGDVVVSEVMFAPTGRDLLNEYIELYNAGDKTVYVNGWTLTTETTSLFKISQPTATSLVSSGDPLALAPGEYLVLLKSDIEGDNGGVDVDIVEGNGGLYHVTQDTDWFLSDSNEDLFLDAACDDNFVDTDGEGLLRFVDDFAYDAETLARSDSYSVQVDPDHLNTDENQDPENMCSSSDAYGSEGNFGSPGEANVACQDVDGDGYCATGTINCLAPNGSGDCNDIDEDINPGADEVCDGSTDEDCDSDIDEGGAVDADTWFLDNDDDDFGQTGETTTACSQPAGYAAVGGDCDDDETTGAISNPDADEICDEADNDCDDTSDEGVTTTFYLDDDDDDFGVDESTIQACAEPSGYASVAGDCDDGETDINPDATEVCDSGVDNDCDGLSDDADADTDEGSKDTFFEDSDSDTFGDASSTIEACEQPDGYVTDDEDCNDDVASVNPDGTELVCNGLNDDCAAGTVDAPDEDGDGVDICDLGELGNSDGLAVDCDDDDDTTYPGADELLDTADNDCDGCYNEDEDLADGSVIISEVLADPAGADGFREYIELYNTTGVDIAVSGWNLSTDDEILFRIDDFAGPAIIGAGEYLVLLKTDLDDIGGVDVDDIVDGEGDYALTDVDDWALSNVNSSLFLRTTCLLTGEESTADSMEYDVENHGEGTLEGASVELSLDSHDGDDNDLVTNYCLASTEFNDDTGDLGSPGAENGTCDEVDNDLDGFTEADGDCDDGNPDINPGEAESTCNGLDDDCDDDTDDAPDEDGDGYDLCEAGDIGDGLAEDCDDDDEDINPGEAEITCNGVDEDCSSASEDAPDEDSDGYDICAVADGGDSDGFAVDCNDALASINPGETEITCNGVDEDCTSGTDDSPDVDGDGHDICDPADAGDGFAVDCDDNESTVNVSEDEVFDLFDNDCDGCVNEEDAGGDDVGAVIISEVFVDGAGADGLREWIELYNTSATDLSLEGWTLSSSEEQLFRIASPAVIEAGERLVLLKSELESLTGVDLDDIEAEDGSYALTDNDSWSLDNDGTTLLLTSTCLDNGEGETIDSLSYSVDDHSEGTLEGAAVNLDPASHTAAGNDSAAAFCLASTEFNADTGDKGTPGGENDDCDDIDNDGDGVSEDDGDCDDSNADINPSASEVLCNGLNDDCDGGTVDAPDVDNDGYDVCEGDDPGDQDGFATDCDDTDEDINPGESETTCNDVDDDCSAVTEDAPDVDGDGYDACDPGDAGDGLATDCDDGDEDINPGASEITCTGIDEDCDAGTDDTPDVDGDGHDICAPGDAGDAFAVDCDDSDDAVNVGETEVVCNALDDDCSASTLDVDDDDADGYDTCDAADDGDTDGRDSDCDDSDEDINPGEDETECNAIDDDCDTGTDDTPDVDGDGHDICAPGDAGDAFAVDCDDSDDAVNVGETEVVCNGLDDDCSASTLDVDDDDADGYDTCDAADDGDTDGRDGDCDDSDDAVNPGEDELLCNGLDDDCDAGSEDAPNDDSDAADICDADEGGDTDGLAADCDDSDDTTFPGATEILDLADNDCDGCYNEDAVGVEGALVISEVFVDPTGSDRSKEWIELFNDSTEDLRIDGWNIATDEDELFTIDGPAIVASGEFIVLLKSEQENISGVDVTGVENYALTSTTSWSLSNSASELALLTTCLADGSEVEVDIMTYDEDDRPIGDLEGQALFFDNDALALADPATGNDDVLDWCVSETIFNADTGDRGTPGSANELCIDVDNDGDGQSSFDGDCDDLEPEAFDGNTEVQCDEIDNDCNGGTTDSDDIDGDGADNCDSAIDGLDADCDDNEANEVPGGIEVCGDGYDNDCLDGDEVCATPTPTVAPTPTGTVAPTPTGTVAPTPTGTVAPTPTGTVAPTPTGTPDGSSAVFFSEYVEGTLATDRAIEVYNGNAFAIELGNYEIRQGANGTALSSATATFTDTQTIAAGDVLVVYVNGADTDITSAGDFEDTVADFSGNDTLGLYFGTGGGAVLLDLIGDETNPGVGWDVAGTSTATQDHTLVRKTGIATGNTDWDASAGTLAINSEWQVQAVDTFSGLGSHTP